MEPLHSNAKRLFDPAEHLVQLKAGNFVPMYDELGKVLDGIRGKLGAVGLSAFGEELGLDYVEMEPGAAFPLHVHPGDHILYFVGEAEGLVHVDRQDIHVNPGSSLFIPADYPHGVKTFAASDRPLCFVAFGHPHKHVSSKHRMMLVSENGVPLFCPACKAEGLMETPSMIHCVRCGWHTHDRTTIASELWKRGE